MGSVVNQLTKMKAIVLEMSSGDGALKRVLGPVALVSLGIGGIIGAGIFVLTGEVAAQYTGPAIVLSLVITGIGCGFAGLCYAEMASMIPVAGSAYTYAYSTMGEAIAWIIGWDLILEYALGAATVAVGWSGYLVSFLRMFGLAIPAQLAAASGTQLVKVDGSWVVYTAQLVSDLANKGTDVHLLPHVTALFNLPAFFIILLVTLVLIVGIRESTLFNNLVVGLKLLILFLFIGAGLIFLLRNFGVWVENWKEFIPPNQGGFGKYGWSGILRGSGVIFFAYIGFDAVSTAAQEAKDPRRDLPIGILGSLAVCTVLYIAVSTILTASVHYTHLMVPDPVAVGIDAMGATWLSPVVKLGALAGLSSVILVLLLGQSRIFWTMACDGLLPTSFAKVHPRFKTPYVTTAITGVAVAFVAALTPIRILGELVSIGTLLAFIIVCAGVWVLRKTRPELKRSFRTPWVPFVPLMGILVCLVQMVSLPSETWIRLLIWMVIGIACYGLYGFHHSVLREGNAPRKV